MKIKKIFALLMAGVMLLSAAGCGGKTAEETSTQEQGTENNQTEETSTQEQSTENNQTEQSQDVSTGVRLEDDYYTYMNADLLAEKELSETYMQWCWEVEYTEKINDELNEIIDELISDGKTYEKGSAEQRIKDLYECYSDTESRDAVGLEPFEEYIQGIMNAGTVEDFVDVLANISSKYGFGIIVGGFDSYIDMADNTSYIVRILGPAMSLDKETLETEEMESYTQIYFEYVKNLLLDYGLNENEAEKAVEDFENITREFAAADLTASEYNDLEGTYNTFTVDELSQIYSNIDMPKLLKTVGIDGYDKYLIEAVDLAKEVNSLLTEDNLEALKNYALVIILTNFATIGSSSAQQVNLDYLYAVSGVEYTADYKNRVNIISDLEWDFAKIYVEKNYTSGTNEAVKELVDKIIEEYIVIVDDQDWLSADTKEKVKNKLNKMTVNISYPEQWQGDDSWEITSVADGGSLISNMLEYYQIQNEKTKQELQTGVEENVKDEWDCTPQTVNAFYNPSKNAITITLGHLQSPFFDVNMSLAENMGGIGFTIAHEISHAFDSNGSLMDEDGNYNPWWTDEERETYEENCQTIVAYYGNYEVDGMSVNGELTLAENIADLGAMKCITHILDENELEEMFEHYAYCWARKNSDMVTQALLLSDEHSPNDVRVNAVLSSCDAFYQVYNIEEGDGMYVAPEDRVGIWK